MASVDTRVVQMQFKNETFMDKLKDTMKSLDQLKDKSNFSGSAKGIDEMAKSLKGIDANPVTAGIEGLSNKFLALKTIGFTVVQDLTQRFISFGETLAKKIFNVQDIKEGFKEYELNIGSIQTILANTASKGTGLEDVEKALDNLNEYSDKTIYNFAEMTRNIGTFTAAGVDLQTSVESIKGIANLAAISGSSSQQAATAMYQLSQAISTGTLRLMDWNSVTNAGMGGEVFKTALFETGKALGTIADIPIDASFKEWEAKSGSFRDSLEKDWLTAEVLTTTLKAFTGEYTAFDLQAMGYTERQAQELEKLGKLGVDSATKVRTLTALLDSVQQSIVSGWATSFRIVVGNFTEATELFTNISNAVSGVANSFAESRNFILGGWKWMGGRDQLLSDIKEGLGGLASIMRTVSSAWREVFPPFTALNLLDITYKIGAFFKALVPGPATISKIRDIMVALFTVFRVGIAVVGAIWDVFKGFFGLFASKDAAGGILGVVAAIARAVTAFGNFILEGDKLGKVAEKIVGFFAKVKDALSPLGDVFRAVGEAMVRLGGIVKEALAEAWGNASDDLKQASDRLTGIFETVKAKLQSFADSFRNIVDGLFKKGEGGGGGGGEGGESIFSGISERWSSAIDSLKETFDKIMEKLRPVKQAIDEIAGLGSSLVGAIGEADWDRAGAIFDKLLQGGAVAGLLLFAKKIGEGFSILLRLKLEVSESITNMLTGLTDTLEAMQLKLKAEALKAIAIALAILAGAALVLSLVPGDKLAMALGGLATGIAQLVGAMVLLDKFVKNPGQLALLSLSLNMMAASMLLFAAAVAILGNMKLETLAKGIGSITAILAGMVVFAHFVDKNSEALNRSSFTMLSFGIGLLLIARAVKAFGGMDWAAITKGLIALGIAMAIVSKAVQSLPSDLLPVGVGFIAVAIGINLLAMAVERLGGIPMGELIKGVAALAVILVVLGQTIEMLPAKDMIAVGAGLVLVGVALNLVGMALERIGGMAAGDLVKGILGIIGVLIPLAIALEVMKTAMPGAVALIVASVGLIAIAKAMEIMGNLSWGEILKGLVGLAAVILVLAVAANLLTPLLPAMFALGLALTLIGAGFALMGAGAYLAAEAFETLSKIGPKGLENLINAAKAAMKLLPELLSALAEAFLEFLRVLLKAVPEFIPLIVKAVGALIDGLKEIIPKMIAFSIELIGALLDAIVQMHGQLVEAGITLLLQFLQGIRNRIGEVTTTVWEIVIEFLKAVTEKLPELIQAGTDLLEAFITGITDSLTQLQPAVDALVAEFIRVVVSLHQTIIDAGVDMIVKFIEGFGRNTVKIVTAVGNLITTFLTGVTVNLYRVIDAGTDLVIEFLAGVAKDIEETADAAWSIVTNFINRMAVVISQRSGELRSAGINLAKALLSGATFGVSQWIPGLKVNTSALTGAVDEQAKEDWRIKSPSKVWMGFGRNLGEGLVMGLQQSTDPVKEAAADLSKAVISATEFYIEEARPTITPVLDLSRVRTGAQGLGSILGSSASLTASGLNWETGAEVNATTTAGLTFTQIINSPKQLSTGDIYRQTKSQLAMAREGLNS